MNQAQKRKKRSAVLAVVLAAALALTGTFAWQSISQIAKNEAKDVVNPGGRLHDDFSGYNVLGANGAINETKDIYVENFTDPDNGGTPIYARVKLTEYMEIGEGAGDVKEDGTKADTNKSEPLIAGKTIDNTAQWTPYYPDKADDPFREYWELAPGGQIWYMPTFNKDKNSLEADINGTLAGKDGDSNTGIPYDDYFGYGNGRPIEKEANYGNGKVETETHSWKKTARAEIMTMDEWIAAGAAVGPYWVFDQEDGWAYWAQPIEPGTATGCLLNTVTLTKPMDESWYYSINATGQFATAFDWGDKAAGTGFYKDGDTVSDNGLYLLNTIAGAHYMIVKDGETKAVTYADKGETVKLKAYMQETKSSNENVVWSIKDEDKAGLTDTTGISEDGTLTIDANQAYETKFTVIAKSKVSGAEIARREIRVESEGLYALRSIDEGTTETANIDGVDWYVVARERKNGKINYLLWSKEMLEMQVFNTDGTNKWGDDSAEPAASSYIRTYLNSDEFLNNYPSVKELVKETTLKTRKAYNNSSSSYTGTEADFYTTTDKIFLLTVADIRGKIGNDNSANPIAELSALDYTYNGEALAAEGKPLVSESLARCSRYEPSREDYGRYYWLRSPIIEGGYVAQAVPDQINVNTLVSEYYANAQGEHGIRPACWISLAQ